MRSLGWPHGLADNETRRTRRRNVLALAFIFVLCGCIPVAYPLDGAPKDERNRSETSPISKDFRRPQQYAMSTNGDYSNLLGTNGDGQIMTPPEPKDVTVEVPTVQLSDILPSTGFVVIRDRVSGTILSNSTGFFVANDVVLTAAHSVAPLLRRFHVDVNVISNSRTLAGIHNYSVQAIAYDELNSPCQVLLRVR